MEKFEAPLEIVQTVAILLETYAGLARTPEREKTLSVCVADYLDETEYAGSADTLTYRLLGDHKKLARLVEAVVVHETAFFRHMEQLNVLEQLVMAPLIANRSAHGPRRLRLWSAGCSTGEEAYTLAMLVDRLLPRRADWQIEILASDISTKALAIAARANYSAWSLRYLTSEQRDRYFQATEKQHYTLRPEIVSMVRFDRHNLAQDDPAAIEARSMDVILCRNVLIYLTRVASAYAIRGFEQALAPRGWLLLGPSDPRVDDSHRLYPYMQNGYLLYRADEPAIVNRPLASPRAKPASIPAVRAEQMPETATEPERRAARAPAPTLDDLLRKAKALADTNELSSAAEVLAHCQQRYPLSAAPYLLQAQVEQARDDDDAALTAIRRAIYLQPDLPVAYLYLGQLFVARNSMAEARRAWTTAVGLLSRHPVPVDEEAANLLALLKSLIAAYKE